MEKPRVTSPLSRQAADSLCAKCSTGAPVKATTSSVGTPPVTRP